MPLQHREKVWLKKLFKKFYWENSVNAPPQVHKREFGVGTLDDKIKFRHKGFRTERELNSYLKIEAPYYISYSAAYYGFPQQSMTQKCWEGADLIFDLDKDMPYLDKKPMDEVTVEASRLISFLTDDFAIDPNDISVNFSGGKGYHIHVFRDDVKTLSSEARREILDYISGSSLDLDSFVTPQAGVSGIKFAGRGVKSFSHSLIGPNKDSTGWPKRIYDSARQIISEPDKNLKGVRGIGKKTLDEIESNKSAYLRKLDEGKWEAFYGNLRGPVQQMILQGAIAITDDDKQVTGDISRLIRLAETIHGGTGLIARKVRDIGSFDPLLDAIAFSDEPVNICMNIDTPRISLSGQLWGPYQAGETEEVPEFLAVYLILKGLAQLTKTV